MRLKEAWKHHDKWKMVMVEPSVDQRVRQRVNVSRDSSTEMIQRSFKQTNKQTNRASVEVFEAAWSEEQFSFTLYTVLP